MDTLSLGTAGLKGWRAKVADSVATPASRASRLSEDQVRAAVGALFLVLSIVYVIGSIRRILERT
ncbi:MAG: hypothetical protein JJE52_03230 [Acidimicrobiia bacterium]|nr:hypothetical protein [Acidimicrobiia bacterium]